MSVELVRVGPEFFIIEGDPSQGYDLFRCRLDHVGHDRRKFELRAYARTVAEEDGS